MYWYTKTSHVYIYGVCDERVLWTWLIYYSNPNMQSDATHRHAAKSNAEMSISSRKQWPTYELSAQRFLSIGKDNVSSIEWYIYANYVPFLNQYMNINGLYKF